MKRVQHKIEIRRRVLETSRDLFLEKGYAKTTIKEITQKAGITTGSLYHFFKDKEDILLHITQDVFDMAAEFSDTIAGDNKDPWVRFSLEIGVQFYFLRDHKPIAELYLVAHESGDIARLIARSAQVRNHDIFKTHLPDLSMDDFYAMSLAVKGIVHSFIQEIVHHQENADATFIFKAIEMALLIFQAPKTEIPKIIRTTHELIQKSFPSTIDSGGLDTK